MIHRVKSPEVMRNYVFKNVNTTLINSINVTFNGVYLKKEKKCSETGGEEERAFLKVNK